MNAQMRKKEDAVVRRWREVDLQEGRKEDIRRRLASRPRHNPLAKEESIPEDFSNAD